MSYSLQKNPDKKKEEFLYRFFTNYLLTANATEAYMALRPKANRNSAKSTASKLIKAHPEMLLKVKEDLEAKRSIDVMKIEDRRQWLCDVILQRTADVVCPIKDRLAAMRELNKMDGLTDDVKTDTNILSADEQRKLYKKQLEETFGARESNEVVDGEFAEHDAVDD